MNRLILIGNGFDLAHGLKTSYKDFIDDFWEQRIEKIINSENSRHQNYEYSDEFIEVIIDNGLYQVDFTDCDYIKLNSFVAKYGGESKFILKNNFLKILINEFITNDKKWVDIEELYYRYLKLFLKKQDTPNTLLMINQFNEDFLAIQKELEGYLIKTQESLSSCNFIDSIRFALKSSFEERELSEKFRKSQLAQTQYLSLTEKKDRFMKMIKEGPKHSLLLNFNYTNTASFYQPEMRSTQLIHIHGKLDDTYFNPVIFGYGDELDESYQEIENKNQNEYLKNIKSIRYLQTDNYKKMLQFINSDYFQVYIFGHSCGNSDRTLLNTIFEHENCVSIKPFYRKKYNEEGKQIGDNYTDIIMNISRNFTDKASFRDKVVEKREGMGIFG